MSVSDTHLPAVSDPVSTELLNAAWTVAGLTSAEVDQRVAAGQVNTLPHAPDRTVGQIIRANVINPVNGIVGFMLVLIIIADGIGPDMLFGGVIITNSVIGIIQELRARSALNRLAVLTAPHAVLMRNGEQFESGVEEVVLDDLLILAPGAQVVVDGEVVESTGMELNESLLTGESDPEHKAVGAQVLSGSFVSSGSGKYRALKIGADSYAASLAQEARKFSLVNSELRSGVNKILKVLMLAIPPIAILLFWRLMQSNDGDWRIALSGVVAASVAMVPDGLVLLTSIAFMAGVISLSKKNALLRELASVELLARVDTLCLDKTGTITTGNIVVAELLPLGEESGSKDDPQAQASPEHLLAAVGASDPDPNATQQAIAKAYPEAPSWQLTGTVPFSSARKWSAAQFSPESGAQPIAVYMGAPEFLLDEHESEISAQVAEQAEMGRRVILLATAAELTGENLPTDLEPRALVLLEDEVREDAHETLQYFVEQGVTLKVISGDHPGTVAAVARRAGVPDAGTGIDARDLPEDEQELAEFVAQHTVFGRVTPRQKRAMVKALQSQHHVVAMTGDGVNDVLALKDADMGIAMGSGSGASRSVAQLVLMDDKFSSLPSVLAEGRRVMNSVERASNLFIYGTVYAVLISLTVSVAGVEFPFLPRHLTLVRALSVGIPGVFLALAPDHRRSRPGFLARVVRFAVPAGLIAGTAALIVYFTALHTQGSNLTESRTAATVTLLGVGLAILVRLTGSLPSWRWALISAMGLGVILALTLPFTKKFFDLEYPPTTVWQVMLVVVLLAGIAVQFVPVAGDTDESALPANTAA
ncbi:P-type ATPase, translocating [Actinobacteria bacterium IMCC26207]|nr:P-type ATPase, translocating [Actinobacteria bacterium IMCC26207]